MFFFVLFIKLDVEFMENIMFPSDKDSLSKLIQIVDFLNNHSPLTVLMTLSIVLVNMETSISTTRNQHVLIAFIKADFQKKETLVLHYLFVYVITLSNQNGRCRDRAGRKVHVVVS